MRADLRPYPEMRDSGVELLGRVPEHWAVRRLKYAVSFSGGGTPSKTNASFWKGQIPWVSPKDMTRKRISDTADHITEDAVAASAAKIVAAGAVLVVVRSGILRRTIPVAINTVPMAINQDMKAMLPRKGIRSEYLHGLIQGNQSFWLSEWTKQGATVESIEHRLLADSRIPIPPLSEQRAIARFLDDADRRIRRYIRAKERLIELLEEERRATIHEAVTGRIDVRTGQPYPAYKDSGVEWLGEVPEHWEIRRVATVAHQRVSNVDKHVLEGESPVRLCNYMDVYHNERIGPDLPFMAGTATEREIRRFRLAEGDVLVTKDSEDWSDIGVPAFVEYSAHDLVCGYHLAMLRPDETSLDGGYLFQALGDSHVAWQFQVAAAGVTRYGLSHNAIRSIRIPLPPLTEQAAIARLLEAAGRRMSTRRATVARQIALLREYRTRLIADVVTGKLDVREAAAKLPETAPLATDRDRSDTIPTESNPHSTEHDMMKEAII